MRLCAPLLACLSLLPFCGCALLPEIAHQPQVHNPFPQLSRVAVAPFFNLSSEPAVDGRQFALAYYNELQQVPGFEVVPVGVVELALERHGLQLSSAADAQRLAQVLEVDAVVVGAITDFSPYYPPRCGLQVEWYAANPGFHPIPPGYGLPWGTQEEELIPAPLIFEAQMALAREQMATQSPLYDPPPPAPPADEPGAVQQTAAQAAAVATTATAATNGTEPGLPPDWPDPRAFSPPGPTPVRPELVPSSEPVLRHVRSYNGHDADFTAALATYVHFRDDARYGGWQSYLQRSDDFIRFCCHLHIAELLTARGGASETRVVWRWPTGR